MSETTLLTAPSFPPEAAEPSAPSQPLCRVVHASALDRRQFLTAAGGLLLGFTLAGSG